MSYGRNPIRRSSVFEIEADDLTELVRQAFSLTRRRHEYYLRELERTVMTNDPAKVMNEMLHTYGLLYVTQFVLL